MPSWSAKSRFRWCASVGNPCETAMGFSSPSWMEGQYADANGIDTRATGHLSRAARTVAGNISGSPTTRQRCRSSTFTFATLAETVPHHENDGRFRPSRARAADLTAASDVDPVEAGGVVVDDGGHV